MSPPIVAIAGATGILGRQTALYLRQNHDATVRALVRPGTPASKTEALRAAGVTIVEVDLASVSAVTSALSGATAVVSTLNGLADVILGTQGVLLAAAAAAAGVARFVPSDFSLDFTKTAPGTNRNLDLRRAFHAELDAAAASTSGRLSWTSVLNGAFMELLTPGTQSSPIDDAARKVVYLSGGAGADQRLDYTTVANTAEYTAALATDPEPAPKFLRIAGDAVTPRALAAAAAATRAARTGEQDGEGQAATTPYALQWIGSVGIFGWVIWVMKLFGGHNSVMPAWQGMQYMVNMAEGKCEMKSTDNDRYKSIKWTSAEEFLKKPENPWARK